MMKPRERERERHHLIREDCSHDDVISDDGGCSTPPPPPPALRLPTDVICKVFSQLDCGHDDVISDSGGCSTPPPLPPALRPPTDVMCKVFSQLDCDDLLSCSLVCKQWYTDSSELREGWKKEYMGAACFYRNGFLCDAVKIFYPRVKFYPRIKNKGINRFSIFL